ncbi:hypothetical protein FOA43_000182 [Brettanomyces nanus]|uniref:Uncharacterized protein n=1 Tax=Eeniella nana TaxID=13502 RepID=A0A875RYX9_EENNA|nr:uncharacterized protein FOA43_000182 [Brettanomyces nanus]QPG72879.1 hypothetical protein FOA43_000182 [Brettanomyces nanus]
MSLVVHNDRRSSLQNRKLSALRLSNSRRTPIYTVKFNDNASLIASAGDDHDITIWNTDSIVPGDFSADFTNGTPVDYHYLPSVHKSAITYLAWSNVSPSLRLFTASADSTAALLDLSKAQKIKTFKHSGSVNQLAVSKRDLLVTCSDDGSVKLWDIRSKFPTAQISTKYPVLTCCVDYDEQGIFFSGIDPTIHCYDPRNMDKPLWEEMSQSNNVTSLSLCPDSSEYLVSKSIDGSIKYFDSRFIALSSVHSRAKPYIFDGSEASPEDWLIRSLLVKDGQGALRVISGSNDGCVYLWDFASRKLVARLDGHIGSSFDVDYNQKSARLVSCSQDGSLILRDF